MRAKVKAITTSPATEAFFVLGRSPGLGGAALSTLLFAVSACWMPPTTPEALKAWCKDDEECIKTCRKAAAESDLNEWCRTSQRRASEARAEKLWSEPNSRGEKSSSGTCFAIAPDGRVATAEHVVNGATDLKITFHDGRTESATVLSSSKGTDLVTLKVGSSTPNYLTFAPVGSTKAGDSAFTLGFPVPDLLGSEPKFTDGAVSAMSGWQNDSTLMQMSVPVQPGNSGGPLVNNRGEVIGIVTSTAAPALFARVTGALPQGVNWAVKADYLAPLVDGVAPLPPLQSREAAIERVKQAICMVKVRR